MSTPIKSSLKDVFTSPKDAFLALADKMSTSTFDGSSVAQASLVFEDGKTISIPISVMSDRKSFEAWVSGLGKNARVQIWVEAVEGGAFSYAETEV